jgi:hypothetical protein
LVASLSSRISFQVESGPGVWYCSFAKVRLTVVSEFEIVSVWGSGDISFSRVVIKYIVSFRKIWREIITIDDIFKKVTFT